MRRRPALLLIAAAIIALAGFGIKLASEPAIGAVTAGEPREKVQPAASEELPGRVDGKFISFSYPPEYKPSGSGELSGRLLERHSVGATGFGSKSLLVTVEKMPPGGLREVSGYQYRKLYPASYKFSGFKSAGRVYPMSQRLDGEFERIVFVGNAGYLSIIALTSTTNDEADLVQDLQVVLSDFLWKT